MSRTCPAAHASQAVVPEQYGAGRRQVTRLAEYSPEERKALRARICSGYVRPNHLAELKEIVVDFLDLIGDLYRQVPDLCDAAIERVVT
jgi:hypothetical protein